MEEMIGIMQPRISAQVHLDRLRHNLKIACSHARRPIWAVVKANAYGHGSIPIALCLQAQGIRGFCVASAQEALELRQGGITCDILVMGYVPACDALELAQEHVSIAILSHSHAKEISSAGNLKNLAIPVYIKINSGMNRVGIHWQNQDSLADIFALPGINIQGIFSHCATSDVPNSAFASEQMHRFTQSVNWIQNLEPNSNLETHCANSGGVLFYDKVPGTSVRAGIVLFGYDPGGTHSETLLPVMNLYTRIIQIQEILPGETVGYGQAFEAKETMRIAVLSAGYADGYHRVLSNRASVLIQGVSCPLVGNVCMDLMMADVTHVPSAACGNLVLLFGMDDSGSIPLENLAKLAGTIPYELMCSVSARVGRTYCDSPHSGKD
jgi:alanine racemase